LIDIDIYEGLLCKSSSLLRHFQLAVGSPNETCTKPIALFACAAYLAVKLPLTSCAMSSGNEAFWYFVP